VAAASLRERSAAARRHCSPSPASPAPPEADVADGDERGVERRVRETNSERMTAPGDAGARARCLKRQSEQDTAAAYAAASAPSPALAPRGVFLLAPPPPWWSGVGTCAYFLSAFSGAAFAPPRCCFGSLEA